MGQSTSQGSVHHSAMAPATNPKEVEKGHFVHTLATMLDKSLRSNRFDRLVLVAPPHCLGMLKNELTTELHKHLMATVDKDLTHSDVADLTERLRETVRVPAAEQLAAENAASKHAH